MSSKTLKLFSNYYRRDLKQFVEFNLNGSENVIEIGDEPVFPEKQYFRLKENDRFSVKKAPDCIVMSDYLSRVTDIQHLFADARKISSENTRLIMTYQNFFWLPILSLAEFLRVKRKQKRTNWLNQDDIINLLELENFEVVKSGKRFLFPMNIPVLSWLLNKYIAALPFFNSLCLTNYIIARPIGFKRIEKSVSVVVPSRNEAENIENAIKRIPELGTHTEIIFVEGNSTDNTLDTILEMQKKYSKKDIKVMKQEGKGKGDAVRKGFAAAKGDILMILDTDLTVQPEELPKFYEAIASGKGEYINGCRLVYPMEDEAMRTLNILGNKFFSIAFSWLLNQRIKDTLCGTKVLTRENYNKLAKNRSYFGDFDPFGDFDLIFGISKLNLKMVEIPIRYKARVYGDTNISRFKHGLLLLRMVFFALGKIKFV